MKQERKFYFILAFALVLGFAYSCVCEASDYEFGTLTKLAGKYKTDKGPNVEGVFGTRYNGHYYTDMYELFFYPVKDQARKVFEIGILDGASLKMWQEFFPKAVIYGADIKDVPELNSDRMKTFVADQSDRKQLQGFVDKYGSDFDIIIDDGGHTMEQQQVSFGYLFKQVKPGGYYVIEDVHMSLHNLYPQFGSLPDESNTTLTMINRFNRDGIIDSPYMTKEEKEYLTANIVYSNLFSRDRGASMTCIFKKK